MIPHTNGQSGKELGSMKSSQREIQDNQVILKVYGAEPTNVETEQLSGTSDSEIL